MPSDINASDTLASQLKIEEFKILRAEIELRSSEGRTMERNVMVVSAVIYGFLLTPHASDMSFPDDEMFYLNLAWFLPPLLNFLALIRWCESVKLIIALSIFIREHVETPLMASLGWETFLKDLRESRNRPRNPALRNPEIAILSPWYTLFWEACVVGPLAVAILHHTSRHYFGVVWLIVIGVPALLLVLYILPRKQEEPAK